MMPLHFNGLTEDHMMVLKMCRELAGSKEFLEEAELADEDHEYPAGNIEKLGGLGLMGVTVPEEYGGAGMDYISYMLALIEISAGCASTGVIMAVNNSLVCWPISKYGLEDQKQNWLKPLASGKVLGCMALTEPNAGSDAANISTTAKRDGDWFVLNGTKLFITNGREAGAILVFARTDKDAKPSRGISAFLVEADDGMRVGKLERKLGIRGSSTAELVFEDCRVHKSALLGAEGQGFEIAMKTLEGGRMSIAAQALGISQDSMQRAVKFSRERVQFGKPIARLQAIQWMLADMSTKWYSAFLLLREAAEIKDKGGDCGVISAMAKLQASEASNFICDKALQIHGGYGYTKDYIVERNMRDARITEIYEGTSEIMRLVIANDLLRD